MRKWWIVLLLAVVVAACGEPTDQLFRHPVATVGGETRIESEDRPDVLSDAAAETCRWFIDETAVLASEDDFERYRAVLSEAIHPVVNMAYGRGLPIDENQDLALALERIFAGDALSDDLWAIERVGEMLVEDGVFECGALWHNLALMPPPPPMQWGEPPAVEIESGYEDGTADRACDVFIKTINVWEAEASHGAQYGPAMADAVDSLIADLEAAGAGAATKDLEQVAWIWREYPWERANEEGSVSLIAAGEALAGSETGRCGDLFHAVNPPNREPAVPYAPPDPITIDVVAVGEFDPGMACGRARMASMHDIPTTEPLDDDARQAFEALRDAEEAGKWFTSTYRYDIFSRTDDRLVLLGEADDGSLSSAEFERVGGEWRPRGWGTCEWRADRYENVAWQVHPDYPVDRSARTIDLLATDWCGIVTEKDHEVTVVADVGDGTVSFEVWEDHAPRPNPDGAFTAETLACAMGLRLHLRVTLPEPIGSRAIEGEHADLEMP